MKTDDRTPDQDMTNPTMADGGSAAAVDSAPSRIRCRRMQSVTSPRPSPENGC